MEVAGQAEWKASAEAALRLAGEGKGEESCGGEVDETQLVSLLHMVR